MHPYWISWYHPDDSNLFTLTTPYWSTGWRDSDDAETICAAVRADNVDDAVELIHAAYDQRPEALELRFVVEKKPDWSPFSDRFPRFDWMQW